jgi:hypothetical protein
MKETREILDNILHMKKSEYEMFETSTSKPVAQKKKKKANVLPGQANEQLNEEIMEDMENYKSTQELDFEVDDVKDCLEKKKKWRNYIEFRPDYEEN